MNHILTYLTANILMGLDVYTRSFHRNLIQFSLLKFLCYFWWIFWIFFYIYDWCLTLLKKLEPIFFMSELPQFFHVWVNSIFFMSELPQFFSCLSYLNFFMSELPQFFLCLSYLNFLHVWFTSIFSCLSYLNFFMFELPQFDSHIIKLKHLNFLN